MRRWRWGPTGLHHVGRGSERERGRDRERERERGKAGADAVEAAFRGRKVSGSVERGCARRETEASREELTKYLDGSTAEVGGVNLDR